MSIKRFSVLLISVLGTLAVFVPALYATLSVGTRAPNIVLSTLDGRTFRLSNTYRPPNKAVVLEFMSIYCPHCAAVAPYMVKLHDKYAKSGLSVVSVAVDQNKPDITDFIHHYGIDYTVGLDSNAKAADLYKVEGVPTIYIIDRRGKIRYVHEGFPLSSQDQKREAALIGSEVQTVLSGR